MSGRPILNARPLGDPEQVDALILRHVEGQEARDHLGQRRDLVARLGRDAAVRREDRHPLLHDAAGPRRGAGRPSAVLPVDALDRLQGRRPDHRARHAHELHHQPRRAAALQCRRQDRAHRHRCRRNRHGRAQGRHRHRRRLQDGAEPAARRPARARSTPTATRTGARRWPTASEAKLQGARRQQVRRGRRHPSAAAVRGDHQLHASATPSWWSTGRRSSTTAASRCRPSRRATGSTPGRSAPWAWACRSRSAPSSPSPTSR